MFLACPIAAALLGGAAANKFLQYVRAYVSTQEANAFLPRGAKKALVRMHEQHTQIAEESNELGLEPDKAERRVLDDERHACTQKDSTKPCAGLRRPITQQNSLQPLPNQPGHSRWVLRRSQRPV